MLQAVIVAGAVVSSATIRDQHSAIDSAAKPSLIASSMAVAPIPAQEEEVTPRDGP